MNFSSKRQYRDLLEVFWKQLDAHVRVKNDKNIERYQKMGKLLPRERINSLLDENSSFLELSQLAGDSLYGKDFVRAGGVITGIGLVQQRLCMIMCNDYTVKGGSIYPIGLKKYLRAQEIAQECNLINIHLTESGGAALPYQSKLFVNGGRNFYNIAKMSALGVPQLTIVFGSCTAGAAYIPAMSEENVIVRKHGSVFLGGPPLVQAATGEIVTPEELGGADVHCRTSGVTDHYAENDSHAVRIARQLVAHSRSEKLQNVKVTPLGFTNNLVLENEHFHQLAEALWECKHFEIRDLISLIADNDFVEFKELYGRDTVAGTCEVGGIVVGIIASSDQMSLEGASKVASFVQLCDKRYTPLVFLQNVSGSSESVAENQGNRIKAIASLMSVVACSRVPKITLIIGGSYGIENYAMCGRSFRPNFLFTWPTAKVSLNSSDEQKDNLAMEQDAIYGSARLWDDGVINPAETKKVLALSLVSALNSRVPQKINQGILRL